MSTSQEHVIPNTLKSAYRALKTTSRFLEGSHKSPYERFYTKLADALSPQRKLDVVVSNTEVEAFYLGKQSEGDFLSMVDNRILSKVFLQYTDLSLLFNVVWEICSSVPKNAGLFSKFNRLSGRQLWELFLRLDSTGQMELHVEDVCDIVIRIFKANGHSESEETIRGWFYPETQVDFWTFLRAMVYSYVGLLQVAIIQELYEAVTSEVLKEGKLEKKGHVVHNWKCRWFVLTSCGLNYYECQENMLKKGMIAINANSQVNAMAETKGHPFRFRVVDGTSNVVTEISAPDYPTMKEWLDIIKIAIRIHQVNGRNFLHCLRLAKEGVPGVTASVGAALNRKLSPVPSQPPRPTTTPTHRTLASSKSVPLDTTESRAARLNMPLPPPPIEEHPRGAPTKPKPYAERSAISPPLLTEGKPRGASELSATSYNDAPPLPPQRFDGGDTASLKEGVVLKEKKAFTPNAEWPGEERVLEAPKRVRRSSSLTDFKRVQEVRHVKKGRDDYAVIALKKKSSDPSQSHFVAPTEPGRRKLPDTPNALNISDSRPSGANPQAKSDGSGLSSREILENKIKRKKESATTPPQKQKGYATLDFHNGSDETKPEGKNIQIVEEIPKDVKTKFAYSTVVFNKEEDVEKAQQLKKNRPQAPPPVPRYDPNANKKGINTYASESAVNSPGNPPTRKVSLPEKTKSPYNVDYADIDFDSLAPAPPNHSHRLSSPAMVPPPLPDKDPPLNSGANHTPAPSYRPMKPIKVRPQPAIPDFSAEEEVTGYVQVRAAPPNQAPPRPVPRRNVPATSPDMPPVPPRKTS